jgi:hypothetical protein
MQIHNINGVEISFDSNWPSIAISLSGGADSALLAHLLCGFANDSTTIHIINHVRMWKTRPWQQHDAEKVCNWLIQQHPNKNVVRHTNFISPELEYGNIGPTLIDEYGKQVSGDNIEQRAYAEFICHKHNIPAYYNAVTQNPPVEMGGMKERDIKLTEENKHLLGMEHMGRYALWPFRFTDKSWVVKQYRRLGIHELFDLTRSCEGEFEGLDYRTYIPGQFVPQCGKCFWCKERTWAIEYSK